MHHLGLVSLGATLIDNGEHQLPVYFRVDLFKPIIIVNSIEAEGNDAAIFTDLEVGDLRPNKDRMDKAELFSPEIMEKLGRYGMLLHDCGYRAENQFLQLVRNSNMIKSIKIALVNPNLYRAQYALNKEYPGIDLLLTLKDAYASTQQDAYNYYLALSFNLNLEARLGLWEGEKDAPWVAYFPEEKNIYWPFGNVMNIYKYGVRLPDGKELAVAKVLEWPVEGFAWGPPSRTLDSRCGGDHPVYSSGLKYQLPANGKHYEVTYWK